MSPPNNSSGDKPKPPDLTDHSGSDHPRWRAIVTLAGFAAFLVLGNLAGSEIIDLLQIELAPKPKPSVQPFIMWSMAAYALLIAIPFVPGIEIAIGILIAAGPGIALLLYGVTILGLLSSFVVGYCVPLSWLQAAFRKVGLKRTSRLIEEMDGLSRNEQLDFLVSRAPTRLIPFLIRHRYLTIAVLLNVPGNTVIGGGGGISMLAGLSKLYSPPAFLLTLILALAPLTLAILILGHGFLVS